ncbi:hypothetical protein GW17_00055658, partial [Ensete ventricosum]
MGRRDPDQNSYKMVPQVGRRLYETCKPITSEKLEAVPHNDDPRGSIDAPVRDVGVSNHLSLISDRAKSDLAAKSSHLRTAKPRTRPNRRDRSTGGTKGTRCRTTD